MIKTLTARLDSIMKLHCYQEPTEDKDSHHEGSTLLPICVPSSDSNKAT